MTPSHVGKETDFTLSQAYMLYSGAGEAGKQHDMFKMTVIETIVAEVQSTPGEDRCVLMLGYEAQIREMFQVGSPVLLHMPFTNYSPFYVFFRT